MHPVLDLLEQRVSVEDAAIVRHAELESAGLRLATRNEASAKASRKSVTVERSGERMRSTVAHEFDAVPYFEGCMPIEEMARRGRESLRFGPMKPIGLQDPRSTSRPHAVVQLRMEDRGGRMWNLVGFQTRLRIPEQARVFRMIPGLAEAEFLRFGSIHRNSYVNAPAALSPHLAYVELPQKSEDSVRGTSSCSFRLERSVAVESVESLMAILPLDIRRIDVDRVDSLLP
jgi:hypothetical protein